MPTFTVDGAEKKKDVEGKHGPMVVYALSLRNGDGQVAAEWFTKASTPLPSPGSQLEGELEDGPYGKKFKKAFASGGGGFGGRSPADTRAIQRQHSQEMGLRYLAIYGPDSLGFGDVSDDSHQRTLTQIVKPIIDWFETDIGGGGDNGKATPPAATPIAIPSGAGPELATPAQKAATSRKLNDLNVPAETQRQVVHARAGKSPSAAGLREINAAIARADWDWLFDSQDISRPPHLPDTRDLPDPRFDESATL